MEPGTESCPCLKYCCSAFHTYQDVELAKASDLTNDIIPLFARDRYRSKIDYSVLEPSLRLASQLLSSGGAASWLVTMVDGDIHFVRGTAKGARVQWSEIDSMRDSVGIAIFPQLARHLKEGYFQDVEKTGERAAHILQNLSNMIDIDFANLPPDVRGYSKAVEGPLGPDLMTHWPRGVRSQVFVAAEKYFELFKLTTRQKEGLLSNKELERLLLTQFSYAMTLVHEVGHSVHCAAEGSVHRGEPFFGDCALAEGGYDLEAAIFGGLLDGNITMTTRHYAKDSGLCRQAKERVRQGQYVKNALTLTKWPSGIYQHSYHAGHSIMGSRKDLSLVDEVARVPLSFIGDLFSMRYWEIQKSADTLDSLRVPTRGQWLVGANKKTGRHCD
ncbi:hypothetical protein M409DRAFT_53760 [Zasmidium cellare ATCC 36951]|uniref:Uncharacterized protein n=1 Tax=Zasmidium cellare ATCC 36951 TaxID=1080233 RepID=A0A6A6CQQ1_ZASCE|nr:uncharacterized protein M409DRAFT_53760 [Zasmidium cellare ATCC 36951]KAF2167796.1 hypothetical protein M409DRAFT_53760 [Zasmidium cellare ATCC 36951]